MKTVFRTVLILAPMSLFWVAAGQEKQEIQEKQDRPAYNTPAPDPELSSLQKQNAILEEKIKLLNHQQQLERSARPDPLAAQSEILSQRAKLMSQQQSLLRLSAGPRIEAALEHRDDPSIESVRMAYNSLAGIAPDVAKAMACAGKNVVLYGPTQSESLLSIRAFEQQTELLRSRLKMIQDLRAPAASDKAADSAAAAGPYAAASLSGPVLQSVLDLIALFQTNTLGTVDVPADESGVMALVANAAISQGCVLYWPDHFVSNPFNPNSQVVQKLQTLAEVNDGGGGKPDGLQQKLSALKGELHRSQTMSENASNKIGSTRSRLNDAARNLDTLKQQIDFISSHIKNEKNSALQEKLNRTFEKAWEELEAGIRRQLGSGLPSTIEDQNKIGEMSKRLDLLKTRADWLAQYVRDDKDLALQDRLKRVLSGIWDQLDAAFREYLVISASTPKALEADQNELKRWDRYSSDLKELIAATSTASEAYTTFRTALLDGSAGTSPLSRMLRAEALRDLTFDDKFQERAGASVVQLKLQKLSGTHSTPSAGRNDKETYSGGVILSFMQYEPNGKLKNSGVFTAYAAPVTRLKESKAASIAEEKP